MGVHKNDDVTQRLNIVHWFHLKNGAYSMIQWCLRWKKKIISYRMQYYKINDYSCIDLYYVMRWFELEKNANTCRFPYYYRRIGMGFTLKEYRVILHAKHYEIQPLVRYYEKSSKLSFLMIKVLYYTIKSLR